MRPRKNCLGRVIQWELDYHCFTGVEKRRAYVYLPAAYDFYRTRRYPVIYMFDGQNVFFDEDATYGKSWGVAKYLNKVGGQVIIAAIECNSSPENGRLSEYSPFDFYDDQFGGQFIGRGEETMQWFIKTFKPYIDKKFRTIPDREHTGIMGSSMGGLMTLFAVIAHNDVFGRGAALSPSFFVNVAGIADMIHRCRVDPRTVLYMDYGQREFDYEYDSPNHFDIITHELLKKRILLTSRVIPEGTHCEASWERQLPLCMNSMLYGI